MTKIETLELAKEELKGQKLLAQKERKEIQDNQNVEYSRMYDKFFGHLFEEGDTKRVSDDRMEFLRMDEEGKYSKELISISFYKTWDNKDCEKIETSFYSTSENSEYELRRMVLIGDVAKVLLDYYDDLLAEYNQITSKYKKALNNTFTTLWDCDKKIGDINNQIKEIEQEDLLLKFENEGFKFEVDPDNTHKLPSIDVRYDLHISRISSIKMLNKTKSGKSADLEITTCHKVYNHKIKQYENVYTTKVYQKVRMSNIEYFLRHNKEIATS